MNKVFNKIKEIFGFLREKTAMIKSKIPTPRFVTRMNESKRWQKFTTACNKHALLMHIPLSLAMCFTMEWMSRHSFIEACDFVTNHTGAYLYNSYLIFVVYSLVFLMSRQTFLRMVISALWVMLGIVNCIILINRVTPFGFTDINMVGDLLTMQNTNYFTANQAAIAVVAIAIYALLMLRLFFKGKKQPTRVPFWIRLILIVLAFGSIAPVTNGLQETGVLSSYFGNLAQGYLDYGYVYGFTTSMLDRGMSQPSGYSDESIQAIINGEDAKETTLADDEKPNIIVVLLESFYDVEESDFIHTSEDPTPYFHELESEFSAGHLTVPVVGAGTCNTEFEMLTGMSCQFFGPGEYPQKTILKKTDCESYAGDLGTIGYQSHVIHNNGGNFYSRANAFSMMQFTTFTCKEMLDITEYTPLGSWPTDNILIQSTVDSMDLTTDPDFVYTITVEGHGDYPTEKIIENPAIQVTCDGKDEAKTNQWEYYINMIHNVDQFMRDYTAALDARGEDTLVIFFGDHLPTLGLTEDEVATGDLYQTKYVTWNNFGMSKEDEDLTSYQLVSEYLDRLGIHNGTMNAFHQSEKAKGITASDSTYRSNMEMLQYDLLYGKRYAYGGTDLYPASNLIMGSKDIITDKAYLFNGELHIYGQNFTKWSKVYVNGEKVNTTYQSGQCLTIKASNVVNGDTIVVNQLGSSDTIFRTSNEYTVFDPNYEEGAQDTPSDSTQDTAE